MTRQHDPLLDRLGEHAPDHGKALDRLRDRHESKARRARRRAGVFGGVVALSLLAVIVVAANQSPIRSPGAGDDSQAPGVQLVAGPGEFYYQSLSYWDDGAEHSKPSYTAQAWFASDGSGRIVQQGADLPDRDETFGPAGIPLLTSLSDDPSAAIQQLIERGSQGGDSPNPIATTSPGRSQETTSLLRSLHDLFTGGGPVLTPEETAALFEGAQQISDVTTTPDVTDPLGRPATMLSFIIDYNYPAAARVEWYFELTTKQFMGEVWVNLKTGNASGTLIEEAGIAASTDSKPPADALYVPVGSDTPTFPSS